MSLFVIALVVVGVVGLLTMPRNRAALPLLISTCYVPFYSEAIEIGPFHFTALRILIATGFARTVLKKERLANGMHAMDWLVVTWAAWLLANSSFHNDPAREFVFRLGLAYNACGIYFLVRKFCQSFDDLLVLCRLTALVLVPVALEMIYENLAHDNLFYAFGGNSIMPEIRNGHVRAQGPFGHAILCGSIGAACLPLAVALRRQSGRLAVLALGVCLTIVLASASSGPILSLITAAGALLMWRYREWMRLLRWMVVASYVALDVVMNDPPVFLLARIDFVGGSTGWFRARIIQVFIERIGEWWMWGTDYTRHWMPSGVPWSEGQTDLTSQYIAMGVMGGLPLLVIFLAILATGFSFVGKIGKMSQLQPERHYLCWCFGASLFVHAVTFISISYFDQSFVFLYLVLGAIGSVWSAAVCENRSILVKYRVPAQTLHLATSQNCHRRGKT